MEKIVSWLRFESLGNEKGKGYFSYFY